jgi:hypothetical protein
MSPPPRDHFQHWYAALLERHMAVLSFPEVRRAVQALSSLYVERRRRIGSGAALDGAGKRAAFAIYYAPLHFLTVRQIVRELESARAPITRLIDLGCGTGAAGAAWALELQPHPTLVGTDLNGWAVSEAAWSWSRLGLTGRARVGRIESQRLGGPGEALLAAWSVNELTDHAREALRIRLLDAAGRGARILVVEAISRRATPWWESWRDAFGAVGGRADEWRLRVELPETLRLLDHAAGLDHRELTARTLWLDPR